MNDIEEQIEQQAQQMLQPKEEKDNSVNTIIEQKIKDTNDVKSVIDFYATKTALGQEETVSKIVVEKQEELRNDAEAKRIQAETTRISQEVSRIAQEKEKHTLETLLSFPLSVKEVMLGKYLSLVIQALKAVVLCSLSTVLTCFISFIVFVYRMIYLNVHSIHSMLFLCKKIHIYNFLNL